jgi:hypothetical protein
MSTPNLVAATWRKSSRSNGNGGNNCVEMAVLDTVIAVRDSKSPSGPALMFGPAEWGTFIDGAKNGEFDTRRFYDVID